MRGSDQPIYSFYHKNAHLGRIIQMDAKPLNLRDGLRLAEILDKYVDTETSANAEAIDFISSIVNKIDPISFLRCVALLSGETDEMLKRQISIDILTCFIEGLRENKILSLVSFYRSLGLKNATTEHN